MNPNTGPTGFEITTGMLSTFPPEAPRAIVADALEDAGRAAEAALLRSPAPVVADRGRVVFDLTAFVKRLGRFQDWIDSLDVVHGAAETRVNPGTGELEEIRPVSWHGYRRFRGVSWYATGPTSTRVHLPNPESANRAFVLDLEAAEFETKFTTATREWCERFHPAAAAHAEFADRLSRLEGRGRGV